MARQYLCHTSGETMKRLHEVVLRMCRDENYTPIHRAERIEAAVEGAVWEISTEIANALINGELMVQYTDKADLKNKVKEILNEHL